MKSPQILVISLERSLDRRERVKQELSKTNFTWRFIDATDGKLLKTSENLYPAKKVKRLLGFPLTPNEIGCFISHRRSWEECVKQNQITLIFEDDFILLSHFQKSIEVLLNQFNDWELLRLQALVEIDSEVLKDLGEISIVKNHGDPLGATAYLITPQAAKKLIEHSTSIYEPLDHFLEHFNKHHVRVLAVKPYPVTISRVESTIADRPNDRKPIQGIRKTLRSIHRFIDRTFSKDPWFPR